MSTLAIDTIQGATAATSVDMSGVTNLQMPAGHVIQTAQALKTDVFSTSSTSFVDITGLSVDITPKFNTSKILVSFNVAVGRNGGSQSTMQLVRQVGGSDTIINPVAYNQGTAMTFNGSSDPGWDRELITYQVLDAPSTTSQVNYRLRTYFFSSSYVQYVNRCHNSANATGSSTITVQEIAQ